MRDKPTMININGKDVPLWCDIFALNEIQEDYGTISDFERKLAGIKEVEVNGERKSYKVEPDVRTIIYALKLMCKEGYKKAMFLGEELEKEDIDGLLMNIEIPFNQLADILHNEFRRCFAAKK